MKLGNPDETVEEGKPVVESNSQVYDLQKLDFVIKALGFDPEDLTLPYLKEKNLQVSKVGNN